ncbi:DUF4189 domain-containing protein [Amorphus sp. 3PC139-8]
MKKGKISFFRKVSFISALLLVMPGAAIAADSDFVAAVYSKSTGNVAFAEGDSDMSVREKAMSECKSSGASDCELAFAGTNMCISLARSADEKSLGIGAGSSKSKAQDEAIKQCGDDGAVGCNLHDTYCGPTDLD